MSTEAERAKRAAYMREYYAKNREKMAARQRKYAADHKNDPSFKESREKACRKYSERNKDSINAKARDNNWYYDTEKAKPKREKYYRKYPARSVLRTIQVRAEKKGIGFDLTEDWYNEQFAAGCNATGLPFDPNGSGTAWVPHVDKIDPKGGYTMDNCRLVCACFNRAKSDGTDGDVLTMAFALVETHMSRTNDY